MTNRSDSQEPGNTLDAASHQRRTRSFDEGEDFGFKRQRTALACNSCRHRKSRCNGARPVCGTCSDMGFDCVYRLPPPSLKSQPREMASMENRLQLVEGLLRAVINGQQTNADTQAPPLTSQEAASVGQESQCDPSQRNGISLQQSQVQLINNYSTANHASHEDTVDGMGIITFADESKSGHFGPSSNSAFFSHIAKALATDAFPQSRESSRGISGSISRPPSPPLPGIRSGSKMVNPYILPPRSEIMHSVNVFFSITGNFFPYIHQGSMHQMIDELDMTRSTGVRRSSLCLLNALLAIGTSLDVKRHEIAKSREAESDIFFQRALALSPWNIANTTNLETCELHIDVSSCRSLTRLNSASFSRHDTISSGKLKIRTNLEAAWTFSTGGVSTRCPFRRYAR